MCSIEKVKMRLTPRTVVISLIILAQILMVILRKATNGATHYYVVRLHVIVNFESMMMLGSAFLWWKMNAGLQELIVSETDEPQSQDKRWRKICFNDVAKSLLLLFIVLSHLSFVFYYCLLGTEPNVFAVVSLLFLAGYIHVIIFITLFEAIYFGARTIEHFQNKNFTTMTSPRRRNKMALVAFVMGIVFMLFGFYSTNAIPKYTNVDVTINKMHSGNSVNIALLTDIHIGPTVGRNRMEIIVEKTNQLNPDIIAISGDLADGLVRDLGEAARPLCDLKAKYGVFFATGNHEYMHGNVDEWFQFLRECNITVLHNENKRFKVGSEPLCIAGADDLAAAKVHFPGHAMNLTKALSGCELTDTVVLLAHQPNAAKVALKDSKINNNIDLILSGHTHAGQMYPFVPIVYLANAFTRGLYYHTATGTWVYVSAGVNFFGPPVKMYGTCEIINLSLSGPL